jgi:hypothetical protein
LIDLDILKHGTFYDKSREYVKSRFYKYCQSCCRDAWQRNKTKGKAWAKYAAAFSGVLVGMIYLCKKMSKKDVASQGISVFKVDSEANQDLADIERAVGVIDMRKRSKKSSIWNMVSNEPIPAMPFTGDIDTLSASIMLNSFKFVFNDGVKSRGAHALGVCRNYAIFNKHVLMGATTGKFTFTRGTQIQECYITDMGLIVQGDSDLALVRLHSFNFRDITPHIIDGKLPDNFKVARGTDVTTGSKYGDIHISDKYVGDIKVKSVFKYDMVHKEGLCGLPLIGSMANGSYGVLGIHVAGSVSDERASYGMMIDRKVIFDLIEKISKSSYLMDIVSQGEIHVDLVEPLPKSPFNYEQLDGIDFYGKCRDKPVTINKRSSIVVSAMEPYLPELFEENFRFSPQEVYAPPLFKPRKDRQTGEYISPYNVGLLKINKLAPTLIDDVLEKCVKVYSDHIISNLSKRNVGRLSPLSLSEAINGVDCDDFISRINSSTSAGFGYSGAKSKYIPLVDEEKGDFFYREPVDSLKEAYLFDIRTYMQGLTCRPLFTAALKDEPRLEEKVKKGATRLFYMSPLRFLIASRQYLSPFYSLMVEHSDIFSTAVGINMHVDADNMVRSMVEFLHIDGESKDIFDEECIVEGDYSGFDVSNPVSIAYGASSVVCNVLRHLGYNEAAMQIVRGIMTDNIFPVIELNSDVFVKGGMQPSGKYATAEDNSLRGVIMLMYAWYSDPNTREHNFFEFVKPFTYGDDVVAAVREPMREYFNNITYQSACKLWFGMGFTTAGKSGEMTKFVTIKTMSFLKRNFVYMDRLERWVAPLSLESCYRSMKWRLPSRHVTHEDQGIANAASMLWEFYFHCKTREDFDRVREDLYQLIRSAYFIEEDIIRKSLPSYERITSSVTGGPDLLDTELEREGNEPDELRLESGSEDGVSASLVKLEPHSNKEKEISPFLRVAPYFSRYVEVTRNTNEIYIEERSLDALTLFCQNESKVETESGLSLKDIREDTYLWEHPNLSNLARRDLRNFGVEEDKKLTLIVLERIQRRKNRRLKFQSEEVAVQHDGPVSGSSVSMYENLEDIGGTAADEKSAGVSRYFDQGQNNMLDLDDFFARPVEIASTAIASSTDFSAAYPVWDLYTLNPSVRAKLRNFAYIHGDLHVRVVISGTPFHYGRMLLSYQPYAERNVTIAAYDTSIAFSSTFRKPFINYLSQAYGSVTLDVKSNSPVDMVCPFISTKPMHRLFNTSALALADTTSYEDLAEAGRLYIYSINTVESVSATPSDVHLQIYAWMENVQLGCPTATIIGITTESETKVGPVERIASSIAEVLRYVSGAPVIGTYARAGAYVCSGIANVSALFGWSRPVMTTVPMYVKNRPFCNGAQFIGGETAKRITCDPEQGLTVDPRYGGVDVDEMSINYLAGLDSYLHTFAWVPEDTILSSSIFLCRISPSLATYANNNGHLQPTAMMFATQPFRFWRGDIIFRFEIVCSAYHRGKLAFYYEPNIAQYALIDADLSLNKNFIKVVDIQETQSIEFCVRWASPRAWARVNTPSQAANNYQTFSSTSQSYEFVNGYIGVSPFTTIQSPDGSGIEVNVYVRAKEMHVNVMDDANFPDERQIVFQSAEGEMKYDLSCVELNESTASTRGISQQHFGEEIFSFRAALKRYAHNVTIPLGASVASDVAIVAQMPVIPVAIPMYDTVVVPVTIRHIYHYLAYGFLGVRGGVRKRLRHNSHVSQLAHQHIVQVTLDSIGGTLTPTAVWSLTEPRASSRGTVSFVPDTNGGIEFELPYYSSNLFNFSFTEDFVGDGNAVNDQDEVWAKSYTATFEVLDKGGTDDAIIEEFACGEDFMFVRFTGAPFFSV